jgi:hypothetical protein
MDKLVEAARRAETALVALDDALAGRPVDVDDAAASPWRDDDEVAAEAKAAIKLLGTQVAEVVAELRRSTPHRRYERRYSENSWRLRAAELEAAYSDDPVGGTAARIDRWADAVLAGQWHDADRWAVGVPGVPTDHLWLPDRLVAATDALRSATRDPDGALRRTEDLLDVLTARRPVDAALVVGADTRAMLAALRVRLHAGAYGRCPKDLLEALAAASHGVAPGSRAYGDMLATMSALSRLGLADLGAFDWGAHLLTAADPTGGLDGALVAAAGRDLVCAVERASARLQGLEPSDALEAARAAVAELPSVADVGRIEAFVLPVADAVRVALAERLKAEHRAEIADAVLAGIESRFSAVNVAAARLRLEMALDRGEPAAITQARVALGDEALWAGAADDAVEALRAALDDRPEDTQTRASLADALVLQASGQPVQLVADRLEEAVSHIDAVLSADGLTTDSGWQLAVRAKAGLALSDWVRPERGPYIWRALDDAVRAVELEGHVSSRWDAFAEALIAVGAYRAGRLAALAALALDPENLRAWWFQGWAATGLHQTEDFWRSAHAAAESRDPALRAALASLSDFLRWAGAIYAGETERALELGESLPPDYADDAPFHRALLASQAGAPDSRQRWAELWNTADSDTDHGLQRSLLAALHLELEDSALALAARTAAADQTRANTAEGPLVILLLKDDRDERALDRLLERWTEPFMLERDLARLGAFPLLSAWHGTTFEWVRRRAAARAAHLRSTAPAGTDQTGAALVELGAIGRIAEVRETLARLGAPDATAVLDAAARVLRTLGPDGFMREQTTVEDGTGAEVAATAGPAEDPAVVAPDGPDQLRVRLYISSGFNDYDERDPRGSELLDVRLPDARANLHADLPRVDVHVDESLEDPSIGVLLPDSTAVLARIPCDRWYQTEDDARAMARLLPAAREEIDLGLLSFDPPDDALGRLLLWSPGEVAVRFTVAQWRMYQHALEQPQGDDDGVPVDVDGVPVEAGALPAVTGPSPVDASS